METAAAAASPACSLPGPTQGPPPALPAPVDALHSFPAASQVIEGVRRLGIDYVIAELMGRAVRLLDVDLQEEDPVVVRVLSVLCFGGGGVRGVCGGWGS